MCGTCYSPQPRAALRTGGALRQHCCVHAKASSSSGLTAQSLAQEKGCVLGSLPFSIGTVPRRLPTSSVGHLCTLRRPPESCRDSADGESPLLPVECAVDARAHRCCMCTWAYAHGDPQACVCTASQTFVWSWEDDGAAALRETRPMLRGSWGQREALASQAQS